MFPFGKNWQTYAQNALTPARIKQAREAFSELFEGIKLRGKSFLDVGFGQGLSLLLAKEHGAEAFGIDVDPDNLGALETTAKKLSNRPLPETCIASVLDRSFVEAHKGKYDIVHSWGVLHHTGNMNQAIHNAAQLVKEGGHLVIAIYNQHWSSPMWRAIKWTYNKSPADFQRLLKWSFTPVIYLTKWVATRQDPKIKRRGMDFHYDLIDWIGGYPYEYAPAEMITEMVTALGFTCLRVIPPIVPTGCNEFVFRKQ